MWITFYFNKSLEIAYGFNKQRIHTKIKGNNVTTTEIYYIASANMEIVNGTEVTYLYAQGQPFSLHKKNGETETINYLHLDYQGSLMAITDQSGTLLEERNYDAWGRPRTPNTLAYILTNPFGSGSVVKRGYTFHEHLEEFNLINMNGRMYDPLLARFLNADPFIQDNTDAQNYNRYSYVLNNPTKYTDPSGYVYTNYDLLKRTSDEMMGAKSHEMQMQFETDFLTFMETVKMNEKGGGPGGAIMNFGIDIGSPSDGDPIKLSDAERKEYQKTGVTPKYSVCITPRSGIDLGKVSEFFGNAGDAAHWAGLYVGSINKFAANSANQFGYISRAEVAGAKVMGNISRYTKIGGYGIGILGGLVAIGEFRYSKRENADIAKLIFATYLIGVNFVPVIGPVISVGLGSLDAMGYFDNYYEHFNYYNSPWK